MENTFEKFYALLKRKGQELKELKEANYITKLTFSIPTMGIFNLEDHSDFELAVKIVPLLRDVEQGLKEVGKPTKLSGYAIEDYIKDIRTLIAKRSIKKLEAEFKELEAKINAIAPDEYKLSYEVEKLQEELKDELSEDITNIDTEN